MGLTVEEVTVGSWTSDAEGEAKPTAVCIELKLAANVLPPMYFRMHSPEVVDTMIQSLLRHKRQVWPESS